MIVAVGLITVRAGNYWILEQEDSHQRICESSQFLLVVSELGSIYGEHQPEGDWTTPFRQRKTLNLWEHCLK
jgi:hypothetical protein